VLHEELADPVPGQGSILFTVLVNGLNSDIPTARVESLRVVGPTATFRVGGFQLPPGGHDGVRILLTNKTAQPMMFVHEDVNSAVGNRIDTLYGVIRNAAPRKSTAEFEYDASESRWLLRIAQLPRDIDVRDFGVDPRGVIDSTQAIQNAINYFASTGGGTLYFPVGTFKIRETLTYDSKLGSWTGLLIGDGSGGDIGGLRFNACTFSSSSYVQPGVNLELIITDATYASPVVIQTSTPHGLVSGAWRFHI
jgi:hypothetical protein